MIYKLSGIVDHIEEPAVVVNVGGVGYGVQVPTSMLAGLVAGAKVELFIETVVREDAFILYGFTSRKEKDLFNLLTTVQGVGPKAGLNLLSALKPSELVGAIISGDEATISRAPGIGGKTAARIAVDLKDKVAKVGISAGFAGIESAVSGNAMAADAISALINLGYPRMNAASAVGEALKTSPDATLNETIKSALANLTA
jgi:Holliday junction DNA helicase RuvA